MNNVVTLSQLITRLAKTTGADTATARLFLRTFFAEIEERVVAGESVSIKGIGTFRRIDDPLAGAPDGVAFIPDPEMREEVNRRFSSFSPVELAPDVDETELLAPEPEEAEVTEVEPTVAETAAVEPDAAEPAALAAEEAAEVNEPKAETKAVAAPVEEPAEESADESVRPEKVYEEESDDEARKSTLRKFLILAAVAIAIIGAALYMAIVMNPIPKVGWDDEDEQAGEQEQVTDVQPDTSFTVKEVPVEEITGERPEAPSVQQKVEPESVAAKESAEPVYEVVGRKNFLATMARRHYGSDVFWVYIYEANKDKIRNPDNIAAGTRVVIPPKSSIPSIDNPDQARRLAEQKAREIKAGKR